MYTRVLSGVRSMRVMLEILPERALKGGLSIVCALSMPDNTSNPYKVRKISIALYSFTLQLNID